MAQLSLDNQLRSSVLASLGSCFRAIGPVGVRRETSTDSQETFVWSSRENYRALYSFDLRENVTADQ